MTYNELKFLCESRNMSMKELDEKLGFAQNGLKRSFDAGSFPISKVPQLCQILGITPNELFGSQPILSSTGIYAANITGGNTQNSNAAIEALRDELRELRQSLKEKDRQINRLIGLLEKGEKQ